MTVRSIAILSWWEKESDPFARIASALTRGLDESCNAKLYVRYVSKLGISNPKFPEDADVAKLSKHIRSALLPIVRFLNKEQPDVLIVAPSTLAIVTLAAWHLTKRRTKLVINQADTLFNEVELEHSRSPKMRLLPWVARLGFGRADGIVATTEELIDVLKAQGVKQKHYQVIANPVDIRAIESEACQSVDDGLVPHDGARLIVSMGRLTRRKNYGLLLESMRRLNERGENVRLVIIGEGPDRELLEARIAELGLDNVILAGYVAHPWRIVASADAFVMSSDDEAFCFALAEAIACGVPVVATDAVGGGPRKILRGGAIGQLVPRNDPDALASALAQALALGPRREAVVSTAREALRDFEPATIGGQWLRYLDLVTQSS